MIKLHNGYVFFTDPEDRPSLDFDELQKASGSTFTDEQRELLVDAATIYKCASINKKRTSQRKITRRIEKLIKAIEVLRPVLTVFPDGFMFMSQEEQEAILGAADLRETQDVSVLTLPASRPGLPSMGNVANYLRHWAIRARRSLNAPFREGHPKDFPLRAYLIPMVHDVYISAGGTGPECHADATKPDGYSGRFYHLICALIEQIDGFNNAPFGVGKSITDVLARS